MHNVLGYWAFGSLAVAGLIAFWPLLCLLWKPLLVGIGIVSAAAVVLGVLSNMALLDAYGFDGRRVMADVVMSVLCAGISTAMLVAIYRSLHAMIYGEDNIRRRKAAAE